MNQNKLIVVIVGLSAIGLAIYLVGFRSVPSPERPAASVQRPSADPGPGHAPPARPAAGPQAVEPGTVTPGAKPNAERDQLRRKLQQRFGRGVANDEGSADASAQPLAAPLPPTSWSSLPEDYARGIIQNQLIPVAESCYQDIAAKGTGGALTLSVAVIGDEDIGGVIDSIDVNQAMTTLEGDLTECVRQAAYDMEFDPPQAG